MRRLLLMLLTLLIPLQLLAATAEPQLRQAHRGMQAQLCEAAATLGQAHAHALADISVSVSEAAHEGGDEAPAEEDDAPSVQAEPEDPTLPMRIATPDVCWYPFPHVFPLSLSWSSYLRDQLRPPPLA